MIYAIAAIDEKQGLTRDHGISWDLPTDVRYFRDMTMGSAILSGYRAYVEYKRPLPNRRNFVLVRPGTELREGFEAVEDIEAFIEPYKTSKEILWVAGGAKLYEQLLPVTQKLFITQIKKDFDCVKFFPEFKDKFSLVEADQWQTENDLTFRFEVWDSQQ